MKTSLKIHPYVTVILMTITIKIIINIIAQQLKLLNFPKE